MKALYRKYRPTKLEEVVGQEQVTGVLSTALKAGKISHAYLFIGPRGTGKTSVARILAHEVNGFPYETEDDYVDIIEIDGASNRGIDNIRELREKVAIAPSTGKYKIYIIDEVHMLTKEAFNALLKTLEEPPEHAIFIMATTDAYKVPVTITSRAQTYTFRLASPEVMQAHLRGICDKEDIKITDDALSLIVKRGGGSFRDSLSLLDQISTLSEDEITKEMVINAMGLPSDVKITTLLSEITSGDVAEITTLLKDLLSSGVKPETLAEEMITQIIEKPTPELIPLLAKLPEVKAPFAEAKLLVTLLRPLEGDFWGHDVASARRHGGGASSTSVVTSGDPQKAPSTRPKAEATEIYASGFLNRELPLEKGRSATPAPTISDTTFNWDDFLEQIKRLNDAIYLQLLKTKHVVTPTSLEIYPERKIVKTVLSKDNNKRILVDVAGRTVNIHEVDETPENAPKDILIDKISAIMGGGVTNDGGGNPF